MIDETDFRLGASCPTKILHRRAGFPQEDDSFAAWMRAEARKFRRLAQQLFPNASPISASTLTEAAAETRCQLRARHAVAHARLNTEDVSCQVDVIEPDGASLRLYSFVPKCVDLERHRFGLEFTSADGWVRREWREHLELLALRSWVARRIFPEKQIIPLVVVPIRGARCNCEGAHGGFADSTESAAALSSAAATLLRTIAVPRECSRLMPGVERRLRALDAFLAQPPAPDLGYRCKKCEFRVGAGTAPSGFNRCWGEKAAVTPHMFDLAYMYFIQDADRQPVANRLAREGAVSLYDIPEDLIVGEYAARQQLQLHGTRSKCEIILPALDEKLRSTAYPLHFLDIETLRSLLPPHRDTGVNDLVLFQFSVHTRLHPEAALTQVEWLNAERTNPNRRFLAALRAALGETGSVCVWTRYEEVSFAELLVELIASGETGEEFEWLRRFLASGRLVDLNRWCFEHYFHPRMAGRTSIKSVLPAVWSVDSPVKAAAPYVEFPADTDPYAVLKREGAVSDGCLAMEAYLKVIGADPAATNRARHELLRYCRVDTLAMAFVFDYWCWAVRRTSEVTR